MKAKSMFDHPVTGERVMPGQTIDEKGLDKDQLEDLKNRGYAVDGEGYKAGEKVDLAKLSIDELTAYAKGLGIDTGQARTRDRLTAAINAKEAPAGPRPAEHKQAAVVFGPGAARTSAEERTLSAEEYEKQQLELRKARAETEKSIAQSAANKEKAEKAARAAEASEAAAKTKTPPPERKRGESK